MIWFVLGGFGWTLAEYFIHKRVGHGPRRPLKSTWWRNLLPDGLAAQFNHEHLAHHADPTYFAAWWRKLAAAVVAVPLLGLTGSVLGGAERGVPFALGFGAVYGIYEVLHRRIHSAAPLGAYGRWLRRHHLLHHYRTPRLNHGVTSPLFDILFGTHAPGSQRLLVPKRSAPRWLVDAQGEVREPYRADYQV